MAALNAAGQPLTQFSQPLILVVEYTAAQLAERGLDEETLGLMYWDGDSWMSVLPSAGCSVDKVNNRLTAQLEHFTEFALTGQGRTFLPNLQR